jgi:hypothetical protein
LAEIAERGSSLSIPLYVERDVLEEAADLSTALSAWRASSVELRRSAADLLDLVRGGRAQ